MHCMLNLLVFELQEAQFPRSVPPAAHWAGGAVDGHILIAPIAPRNSAAL
jgi:hypothetical protein